MAGDKFYTEDELKKKSVAELKELAEAYIDEDDIADYKTKQPLIAAIIYNLPQQDMVALRVTFRCGWEVANPINYGQPVEGDRYPAAVLEYDS